MGCLANFSSELDIRETVTNPFKKSSVLVKLLHYGNN